MNVNPVLADAVMGMHSADQRAIVAPADLAHILRQWSHWCTVVNFLHLEESFRRLYKENVFDIHTDIFMGPIVLWLALTTLSSSKKSHFVDVQRKVSLTFTKVSFAVRAAFAGHPITIHSSFVGRRHSFHVLNID